MPLEAWPALELESKAEVESVSNQIHELRKKHLCEGSFSPTASILSQLAKGKHFNKMHQSPSNIHWSEDEQTIFYIGQGVELGKIKSMCHTLVQELQESMRELMFGSNVPSIELGRIVDSMSWSQAFRRQNFSFIDHGPNKEQAGVGYRYLLERARKGEGAWRLLRKSKTSQGKEWVDGQMKKYLTKEKQFLRKLMVCMHITGKPAPKKSKSKAKSSAKSSAKSRPKAVPKAVPKAGRKQCRKQAESSAESRPKAGRKQCRRQCRKQCRKQAKQAKAVPKAGRKGRVPKAGRKQCRKQAKSSAESRPKAVPKAGRKQCQKQCQKQCPEKLIAYRWPASPWTRIGVDKNQQQYIFGPEYLHYQWASMFFNHVRQSPKTKREYRVHHTVFAGRIESGFGAVFSICEPIRPGIAIGSAGIRIFVW